MEYTINKLAGMAGVSTRTLRYYDEIGLLPPARKSSSGYRIYGGEEVNRLQEILLYRTMGVPLEEIGPIMQKSQKDRISALENHLASLMHKQTKLQVLIATVQKTLADEKGFYIMKDNEKFDGLKEKLLNENEEKYGEELRRRYDEDIVKKSNEKWARMTETEFNEMNELNEKILNMIKQAMLDEADPKSAVGLEIAGVHKAWLSCAWGTYNEEAHAGLVQMYVDDERFTAYYDKAVEGATVFLKDAVLHMLGKQ